VYPVVAFLLIPWTVYLSITLPTRHVARHWDLIWVGFDICLLLSLLFTGILAYRKSKWVIIAASSAGTLLLVDAWFDVLTARNGSPLRSSLLFAIFAEIPLAIITYSIAYRVIAKNI